MGVVAGHVAVGGEDGDSGAVTADGDGIADRYGTLVAAGLGIGAGDGGWVFEGSGDGGGICREG